MKLIFCRQIVGEFGAFFARKKLPSLQTNSQSYKTKMHPNLWKDLGEIGFGCLQSASYALAIAGRLEQELQAEGITIEDGILLNSLAESKRKPNKGQINNSSTENDRIDTFSGSFVDSIIDLDADAASILIEKIKISYVDAKPIQYIYMLYALHDLGLIINPAISKKSLLYRRLNTTFGEGVVGVLQNLNKYINKLNAPSQEENAEIQRHKKRISTFLR